MATNSELIRSHSLPRTLELRVATGKAAEALAIFLSTNQVPTNSTESLLWAAGLLRLSSDQPLRSGRSIGAYKRDVTLLAAAKRAKASDQMKELATTLATTRNTLEQLAKGQSVPTDRVQTAFETLEAIRASVAARRSSTTERILRGRPRG